MVWIAVGVWLVSASVSVSAQNTPASQIQSQPAGQAVTITGCVAAVQRDGSLGAKAAGTAATPESAPFEANNPEPTGKFILNDAGNPDKPTSYGLQGHEKEIAPHVGHRVEIVGTLLPPVAAKVPSAAAKSAEGIRAVRVSAVKMIGTDCSPRKPQP